MSTLDTSSASLKQMGLREMAAKQKEIFDVVLARQREGQADMSLTEIRDAFESRHGRRIDLNRVSSRVSELVDAQRLERTQEPRACSISGRMVHPVYVPAHQARLCA
jgi:hypothetical protein